MSVKAISRGLGSVLVLLILASLLLTPNIAEAKNADLSNKIVTTNFNLLGPIIYVDVSNISGIEDGTQQNPFNTIQEGITAAINGDTVLVAAGTYTENVDFKGKAITVKGIAGAGNTIIDGGRVIYGLPVVQFISGETQDAVLEGFTLTHRAGTSPYGSGIYIVNGSNPTIKNCIITENSADTGGGIYISGASATIINSVITGNRAFGNGGGISTSFGPGTTVINSIIAGNRSGAYGGGIAAEGGVNLTVLNSTISDNTAVHGGGGNL